MKWIRRDILPNTNTENYEIAFKIVIQKYKRFIYLPKNVRAQSQKLAPNISKIKSLKYFESIVIEIVIPWPCWDSYRQYKKVIVVEIAI